MSLQTAAPAGTAPGAVPLVPGSLLLGSALDLRRDMLGLCERAFPRYGDAVRFRFGIGQHFSMLESVIALATLVRGFQFAAPPGEPARTSRITLRPAHGVPSHVTAR